MRKAGRPAVVKRPGAGVAIDTARLLRIRQEALLSRAGLALKMSHGPCPLCGNLYTHRQDCQNSGEYTITPDAIAKIENGYRKPKTSTLSRLCSALGCEPDDLLPVPDGKPGTCPECKALYGHEPECSHAT